MRGLFAARPADAVRVRARERLGALSDARADPVCAGGGAAGDDAAAAAGCVRRAPVRGGGVRIWGGEGR